MGWSDFARKVKQQEREQAHREGMIAGLERALEILHGARSTVAWSPDDAIRAEIDAVKKKHE